MYNLYTKSFWKLTNEDEFLLIFISVCSTIVGGCFVLLFALSTIYVQIRFPRHHAIIDSLQIAINVILLMANYFTWTSILAIFPFKFLVSHFCRPTKFALFLTITVNLLILASFFVYINQYVVSLLIAFGLGVLCVIGGSLMIGIIYVHVKLDPNRLKKKSENKNVYV